MTCHPDSSARQRGLVVVNKAEQLIQYLSPAIDRIPKAQRYRYAARLEDALWELVRRLFEAAVSNQRSKVYRADEQVRFVHALFRHADERGHLHVNHVGNASSQLSEIGAMIGAWRQRLRK